MLSEQQLAELRQIIDEWRAANPTQYYVAYIRFTDFANAMRVTADPPKAPSPEAACSGCCTWTRWPGWTPSPASCRSTGR